MIEINNFGKSAEFPDGKDVVIEKFIELILKNAPKYDYFSIYEMNETLNLNKLEKEQFKDVSEKLKKYLIKKGMVEDAKGSNLYVELTEQGQNYFNEKASEPINFTQNIENYIGRDNNGNQSSRSNLKKIDIKHNVHPKANENKPNTIISFLSKVWWQILIPLAIVVIGILVEKGIINIGI